MNYLWETFKITFYLFIVIAFILAIYYLIKNRFKINNSNHIEVIDTIHLANGERIYLLKTFDEIIMVGSGKEELTFLKSWPVDKIDINLKETAANKKGSNSFKNKLKNIIAQDKNTQNKNAQNKKNNAQTNSEIETEKNDNKNKKDAKSSGKNV